MLLGLDGVQDILLFVGYIALWSCLQLSIYSCRTIHAINFNATSAALAAELLKLAVAVGLFLICDGGIRKLLRDATASSALLVRYMAPALLYSVSNSLTYINLSAFDPGTYVLVMQLRIVLTGLVFQFFLSKTLNRNQWLALLMLTVGSAVLGAPSPDRRSGSTGAWLLLLMQICCAVDKNWMI